MMVLVACFVLIGAQMGNYWARLQVCKFLLKRLSEPVRLKDSSLES